MLALHPVTGLYVPCRLLHVLLPQRPALPVLPQVHRGHRCALHLRPARQHAHGRRSSTAAEYALIATMHGVAYAVAPLSRRCSASGLTTAACTRTSAARVAPTCSPATWAGKHLSGIMFPEKTPWSINHFF